MTEVKLGNALPRHERGHKMLCLYNNLIIIYPIKLTGIMLIRDINSFIYIDIRKMNQNSNDPQPYVTLCENCSFVVA